MTGNLLLVGALVSAIAVTTVCYVQKIPSARLVKICAGLSATFVTAASLLLWTLIFANDFTVEYVAA